MTGVWEFAAALIALIAAVALLGLWLADHVG